MTIPEAIKELTKAYSYPMNCINLDLHDATKLGIEALKRIASIRSGMSLSAYVDLPGETKRPRSGGARPRLGTR